MLKPDVSPTERRSRPAAQETRGAGHSLTSGDPAAPEALAASAPHFAGTPTAGRSLPPRRLSFALAGAAAILVGAVLTVAGGFEYRCAATLQITGQASPAQCAVYRKELLDYSWDQAANMARAGVIPRHWFVDSPGQNLLRLCVTTSDRKAGVDYVRRVATGYRQKMEAMAAAARDTPTEAEEILTRHVGELRTRLGDAQDDVGAAVATLPETDPSEHRRALLGRWQDLQTGFGSARRQLSAASASVARFQSAPQPTHGLVSSEQRREALEADDALGQDLRELAVNLTELKLHLLNVWQRSAGPMERLVLLTDGLLETASRNRDGVIAQQTTLVGAAHPTTQQIPLVGAAQPATQQEPLRDTALAVTIRDYRDMLEAFADDWNHEFTTAKRLEVDPQSGEILDVYQHARRRLNDFLFDAAKRLASMRSQVQGLAEDPTDSARHHVFQSNLVRAVQTMQSAHHRFEFAAGTIETPDNFRLDTALRAARGLRRRSQDRIQAIEEKLQERAAEAAGERRMHDLTEAKRTVKEVRSATDLAVDELLALQEELNLSAKRSEAFLRVVLKAEVATARLTLTQADLNKADELLQRLVAQRTALDDRSDVELISCGAINRPVNLAKSLRLGALGAALMFLTVLLAQWWITRR